METPPVALDFFAPCLQPSPAKAKQPFSPAQQIFAESLPLLPREARAALSEITQTGAYQWQAGILHSLAATAQNQQAERNTNRDESLALANLIQTATTTVSENSVHPESPASAIMPRASSPLEFSEESLQKTRISGHIMLLLILDLEKSVLESQVIAKKYLQAQKDLHGLLNDDVEATDQAKDTLEAIDSSVSFKELIPSVSCPWQTVLHAIALFLPENVLLYTDDSTIAKELKQRCDSHDFFELKDDHGGTLLAITASIRNITGTFSESSFSSEAILAQKVTLAFPCHLLSYEVAP